MRIKLLVVVKRKIEPVAIRDRKIAAKTIDFLCKNKSNTRMVLTYTTLRHTGSVKYRLYVTLLEVNDVYRESPWGSRSLVKFSKCLVQSHITLLKTRNLPALKCRSSWKSASWKSGYGYRQFWYFKFWH